MTAAELAAFWDQFDGIPITGTPPEPVCAACDADYAARADFYIEAAIDLDDLLFALQDPDRNGQAAIAALLDEVESQGVEAELMHADLEASLDDWDAGARPALTPPCDDGTSLA